MAKFLIKLRGIDVTTDWKPNEQGQVMAHIQVKRWYIPVLMLKGLRQARIPYYYWPLLFWHYYVWRRYRGRFQSFCRPGQRA